MKHLLLIALILVSSSVFGQHSMLSLYGTTLHEIKGTDYLVVTINRMEKSKESKKELLFVNTRTGEHQMVEFPGDSWSFMDEIVQVRIDSLGISYVLVTAKTKDLDGKKGLGFGDPEQLFILSTDGTQRTKLTADSFYVKSWVVKEETRTIAVYGYYDTNNNRKNDKGDQSVIEIYDLKSLKLINSVKAF